MKKSRITKKEIEKKISMLDIKEALNELYRIRDSNEINVDNLILRYSKKVAAFEKEKLRFDSMCNFERKAYINGYRYVAGIDEAGRGPLAGPVVAGVVILPKDIFIKDLKDSKKLSAKKRDQLYEEIKEKCETFAIGMMDEKIIDNINILNATKKAMEQAINSLPIKPDILLVDAVNLKNVSIPQIAIEQGDNLSISIAAASIIAKVTRDRLLDEYDKIYPQYGFAKHKGYGTKEHIEAIIKYGICPIHRLSFVKKFLE